VAERISDISTNLDSQLKNKVKLFVTFSVDESTDSSDIAPLAISVAQPCGFPVNLGLFFWSCGFFWRLAGCLFLGLFFCRFLFFWLLFLQILFLEKRCHKTITQLMTSSSRWTRTTKICTQTIQNGVTKKCSICIYQK